VAARTFAALGDVERAARYAAEAERTASLWESGTWHALAAMARAAVLQAQGDHQVASERFLAAAERFDQLGQPYDAACCRLDAGLCAIALGDEAAAGERIGQAHAAFQALGAASSEQRARQHLSLRA
jgi:ATP/maltotriose-dependent transcriptional regulator MalT